MTDGINGYSSSLASDALDITPGSAQFGSIDEMQSACEADGWSVEFRQLQAGELTASTVSRQCDDISLLDHCVSRRIEAVGQSPKDHVTLLAPAGRGEFWANGQSFDSRGLFLLGPGAELHTLNNDILRVLSAHVPTSLLQETLPDVMDAWESRTPHQTMVIDFSNRMARRLRALISPIIHQPITRRWQVRSATALAAVLSAAIVRNSGTPTTDWKTSQAESWRVIHRAREFIEANLTEPIAIRRLCAQCATSTSKLERIFRRELQMSPS